jgi:hypothetical protein
MMSSAAERAPSRSIETLPFDRIVLVRAGEAPAEYTPWEFAALPLFLRVRYALEGSLRFFQGHDPVDHKEALRALRESAAPPTLGKRRI